MSTVVSVQVDQVGPATSEGHARTHTALIDRPEAKGGQDRGAMGGEYLLMALGGCFMSNLLAAIRAREAQISNVRITVNGTLEGPLRRARPPTRCADATAPQRFSAIEMIISADHDDEELMKKLVTISERACIVANTLKGGTDLSLQIE